MTNMKYLFSGIVVLVILGVGVLLLNNSISKQKEQSRSSVDNAPPGSIHNLPVPEAVAAVRAHVAREMNAEESTVIVITAYKKEWGNSCLGLSAKDEMCAEIITPGYEVTVQVQNKQFVYRTNADGTTLRKKS